MTIHVLSLNQQLAWSKDGSNWICHRQLMYVVPINTFATKPIKEHSYSSNLK